MGGKNQAAGGVKEEHRITDMPTDILFSVVINLVWGYLSLMGGVQSPGWLARFHWD